MADILEIKRPNLYTIERDNGDGTVTATISGVPFNYLDENGKYQGCELDIIPEKNWEFEYAVKKNNFRAYFNDSTDIENFTLASFEIINSQGVSRWINYKLVGAAPDGVIINKNKIKYTNVFPGIDLEYVVNTSRLKENIIINSPVDNFEYTFSLKLDGVNLLEEEDGSILFTDKDTNETLWRINSPYAFGSGDRHTGVIAKRTTNVSYSLGKIIYNEEEYTSITVKLDDPEFIATATYPITIDPTTTDYLYPDYGNADDYYRQTWCPATTAPDLYNWGTAGSSAVLHYSALNAYKAQAVTQVLIGVNSDYDNSWGSVNATVRGKFFIADWTGQRAFNNLPAATGYNESAYAYNWEGWTIDMTSQWNAYKGSYNFYGINVYPGNWPVTDSNTYAYVLSYVIAITYTIADTTPPGNVTGLGTTKISNSQINLSWTKPGDADFSYCKVYRDGTYIGTGTTSYADTTVGATSNHSYRVTSVDTNGNESGGTTVNFTETTAPGNVTGLSAVKASATQINLTWTKPGDADFSYCKVYRDSTYIGTGNTSYNDTSVSATSNHSYRVTSVDTNGNESAGTTVNFTETTAPAEVTGLSAVKASATQINLAWTNPGDADLASCKIYRDGGYLATVTKPTTTYNDTTVSATVNHSYKVTTVDTNGNESAGNTVNFVESTAPADPTGITAVTASATVVNLAWTNAADSDLASCKIYRDSVYVATVNKPTTTYADTTTAAAGHTYKITSVDTNNNESAGATKVYTPTAYTHKVIGITLAGKVNGVIAIKVMGV